MENATMSLALMNVTVDCDVPPGPVARWWATALGAQLDGDWGDAARVRLPGDGAPRLLFERVPEPKRGKNRVHVDLLGDDRDAEVERLTGLGATVVARHDEAGESWTVMQDPYGNEFCVN
jgi:Glyoxalase-like domain